MRDWCLRSQCAALLAPLVESSLQAQDWPVAIARKTKRVPQVAAPCPGISHRQGRRVSQAADGLRRPQPPPSAPPPPCGADADPPGRLDAILAVDPPLPCTQADSLATMAATLGAAIQGLIANIEQHTSGGASYATAADDLLQLRGMLAAWEHFRAQRQKECVEAFGGAVQHDAPTLNPSADLPFTRYLAQALLESEKDPSVDATAVAAGGQRRAAPELRPCLPSR